MDDKSLMVIGAKFAEGGDETIEFISADFSPHYEASQNNRCPRTV